ncbi:MAG: molybdate ABC transporter substrate-binding protein [Desulfobacteraceae bacterium]
MRGKRFAATGMLAMATLILTMMGGNGLASAASDTVTVFAAASTTNAITEIGTLFTRRSEKRFLPSFAASSTLAKQIENGAPADIYISANVKWMDYLQERRMIEPATRFNLLGNRIVLIVPSGSGIDHIEIAPGFDLLKIVGDGLLSMGDPDHVPAGIYGKLALQNLGVWSAIENHVARSKDVRAALTLVERGEAPAGLVYATDAAITERVKVAGTFPLTSHPPIIYPIAVVTDRRSPATDRFMQLLRSPEAGAVFEKFGFSVR